MREIVQRDFNYPDKDYCERKTKLEWLRHRRYLCDFKQRKNRLQQYTEGQTWLLYAKAVARNQTYFVRATQ